jgi:hypothetical protein
MEALPGTLGGQLWGEGTIEPPSHGSPAIQSRFEVPRSKERPDSAQPAGDLTAGTMRGPTRLTRRGSISGSGSARLDLSQKGDLPSSGERVIFIWSKVAGARKRPG